MSSEETFSEYVKQWLNKLDLKIDITQQQLQSALTKISGKIIAYKITTSILTIVILSILLIVMWVVYKKYTKNIKVIKTLKEYFKGSTSDGIMLVIFTVLVSFITLFVGMEIATKLWEIGECILFPEKIIIEFIGGYM